MDAETFDLTQAAPGRASTLEATMTLTCPQSRLRLRLPPGEAGRAEAVFDGRSWAAKHYWHEGPHVVVYEFDELLPSAEITLRVPFTIREH